MHRFFLLLIISVLSACATSEKGKEATAVSALNLFTPGASTSSDAQLKLGKPDIKADLPENETAWLYLRKDGRSTRLAIILNTQTSIIKSIHWYPSSEDPEVQLTAAKALFPKEEFVQNALPWVNSHASPDEVVYNNANSMIHIILRKTRNEVSGISKTDGKLSPRKPASKYEL